MMARARYYAMVSSSQYRPEYNEYVHKQSVHLISLQLFTELMTPTSRVKHVLDPLNPS